MSGGKHGVGKGACLMMQVCPKGLNEGGMEGLDEGTTPRVLRGLQFAQCLDSHGLFHLISPQWSHGGGHLGK